MGLNLARRCTFNILPLASDTLSNMVNPTHALAHWLNAFARAAWLWSRWLDRWALELWGM